MDNTNNSNINALTALQIAEKNKQHLKEQADYGLNQQLSELDKRDISYVVKEIPITDENGNILLDSDGNPSVRKQIVITSIPDPEKWTAAVFAGIQECWFDGCQELRDEFKQRLASAAADDEDDDTENISDEDKLDKKAASCSNCQRARIIRSMHAKVLKAVKEAGAPPDDINVFAGDTYRPNKVIIQDDGDTKISGTSSVQGSAQSSTGVNEKPQRVSFVRRILDRVAASLGYRRQA